MKDSERGQQELPKLSGTKADIGEKEIKGCCNEMLIPMCYYKGLWVGIFFWRPVWQYVERSTKTCPPFDQKLRFQGSNLRRQGLRWTWLYVQGCSPLCYLYTRKTGSNTKHSKVLAKVKNFSKNELVRGHTKSCFRRIRKGMGKRLHCKKLSGKKQNPTKQANRSTKWHIFRIIPIVRKYWNTLTQEKKSWKKRY